MKYSVILLLFLSVQILFGQEGTFNDEYKKEVITTLTALLTDYYVFPEVATETNNSLREKYESGEFDQYEDNESFAQALTKAVQSVSHDKHMRIFAQKPYEAPANTLERKAEERMDQINNYRLYNHGFTEAKIIEGNVGYLDLRGFSQLEMAKEITDAYMKLLSQSDAVIIDLRKNGGGDPNMVQYLCSYFFDEVLHLNSLYYREGDRTEEYWTLEEVSGQKMSDVPLYVMISEKTFSGAEEFAYNMQTQKRATLIGQTTGGGANPGGTRGINENLSVFIPTGKAINPITNTNWEGVGVIPDIPTTKDQTFERTLTLAQNDAEARRKANVETYVSLHSELDKHLKEYKKGESESEIHEAISSFVDAKLFGEWDVNGLGYEYLLQKNKPKIALCIFKSNTKLFPESPNVYDSYGEALKMNGNIKASIENYQKAVDVATKNNDANLPYYQEALQKVKSESNNDHSNKK